MVTLKHNKGFVALAAVLILSAIFLSVAISIASKAISQLDTDLALFERDAAAYAAEACIESMLLRLQNDLSLTDVSEVRVGGYACQTDMVERNGQEGSFRVESQVGDHAYRLEVVFEEISPQMVVSSVTRIGN